MLRNKKVWLSVAVAALALASASAIAWSRSTATILETANRYTVKIYRIASIGLNEDSGASAQATGFLVDKSRGWVLTNAHVASRSPVDLFVSFKDQKPVRAKRIFVDRITDVAVVEFPPESIPAGAVAAELVCAKSPAIGSSVAVFGHPGDLSYTASRGIVSSMSWVFPNLVIQSDAIVNAGNSGGPLIDLNSGKVVGVASASYRDTDDDHATAVSLSEPIGPICKILSLLKAGKDARYRQLPAAYATAEDEDQLIVANVFDANSGLQVGDTISAINGITGIRNASDLAMHLRAQEGKVTVSVLRDGAAQNLSIETQVMPNVLDVKSIYLSGLVISDDWRLDREELRGDDLPLIDYIEGGTHAEMTKAEVGQRLVAVNNRSVSDLNALFKYLESLPSDQEISLILKDSAPDPFYRKYHYVTFPGKDLRWIYARDGQD